MLLIFTSGIQQVLVDSEGSHDQESELSAICSSNGVYIEPITLQCSALSLTITSDLNLVVNKLISVSTNINTIVKSLAAIWLSIQRFGSEDNLMEG